MTIEIRQLIIRAVVEDRRERASVAAPRPEPVPRTARPENRGNPGTVVAECTRQVLRELRRGRGR